MTLTIKPGENILMWIESHKPKPDQVPLETLAQLEYLATIGEVRLVSGVWRACYAVGYDLAKCPWCCNHSWVPPLLTSAGGCRACGHTLFDKLPENGDLVRHKGSGEVGPCRWVDGQLAMGPWLTVAAAFELA